MSSASMKADPTIPKTFFVPWAERVSTKASLEVIETGRTDLLRLTTASSELKKEILGRFMGGFEQLTKITDCTLSKCRHLATLKN